MPLSVPGSDYAVAESNKFSVSYPVTPLVLLSTLYLVTRLVSRRSEPVLYPVNARLVL